MGIIFAVLLVIGAFVVAEQPGTHAAAIIEFLKAT